MAWSVGELRKKRFRFQWRVKESQLGSGKTVMSTAFEDGDRSWCLKMEQSVPASNRTGEMVTLSLGLLSSSKLPLLADYKFGFNKLGQFVGKSHCKVELFEGINSYGRPVNLFSNGNKTHHFVDGELDIVCDIFVFDDQPAETKFESKEMPKADLGSLLEIGHFDVTLIADDKEIRAHKIILSGRSAVFAQMFEHNMQENSSNVVKIEDIEANTLQDLIAYIYTGETPTLTSAIEEWTYEAKTQNASDQQTGDANEAETRSDQPPGDATESEPSAAQTHSESTTTLSKEESKLASPIELAKTLLYAADKYMINGLVEVCEETLHRYLNVENAAEIMLFAAKHNTKQLRRLTIAFIVEHRFEVGKTQKWSEVLADNDILKEIYEATCDRYETPPTAKRLRLVAANSSLQLQYR